MKLIKIPFVAIFAAAAFFIVAKLLFTLAIAGLIFGGAAMIFRKLAYHRFQNRSEYQYGRDPWSIGAAEMKKFPPISLDDLGASYTRNYDHAFAYKTVKVN